MANEVDNAKKLRAVIVSFVFNTLIYTCSKLTNFGCRF